MNARAVVACPDPGVVLQPDGTSLTLTLHGDEWFNFATTADGYTVVQDPADGYYKYAVLSDNTLVPSAVVAHDSNRDATELSFLSSTTPYLTPSSQAVGALRAPARRLHGNTGLYDYTNFRGLVILVEYNDCPFVYDDPHTLFNNMINEKDYTGFMSNATFPELVPYTGSVRDYFYSSSAGKFDPAFDVIGPVSIDYSMYYAQQTSGAQTLVAAALDAANDSVNYKDYDRDGDGTVDMVFFLFSGGGSNFSSNDSRLIWPHASTVRSKTLDGVTFGRYACSTELYSRPESKIIDGIGTICHEFSHVLGIADLYDTDGTSSGGSSVTPSQWTIMAQGSYLNQSRTPCAYSVYERYAAGFITPTVITSRGNYTLRPMAEVNNGYRLDTTVPDEYFLLETRVQEGWDAYLPGEGMLVWRVDSTDTDVWEDNDVNCDPDHQYLQLLRANNGTSNSSEDPFPGTAGITTLDNSTTPSLRSWTGLKSAYGLSNITQNDDGSVSFHLAVQNFESEIEDFETMALTTADASDLEGRYTTWSFTGGACVTTAGESNAGNGAQAVSMIRSSEAVSGQLPWEVQSFSFTYFNPTTSTTIVRTYYNTPESSTWVTLQNDEGLESVTVSAGEQATISFNTELPEGAQLRILQYTGHRTNPCYLDDVTCVVASDVEALRGDINEDGVVDITDVNDLINYVLVGGDTVPQDLTEDGSIDVSDVNVLINIVLNKE